MARLANELDRPALQVIDGALSAVLRNYEVEKRETGLSTDVISFPELEIFIGKMRFDNYSSSILLMLIQTKMVCRTNGKLLTD